MPDFNSPKNPLPDLMPLEEGRSTEVSSQELSAIRASLMETSWRTEQIVDVLERKNILLERDLEKITNLKRRLRRSIGIIPGMPGKAGALFGAGVGMGLILPFGFKWPETESPNIPPIGKAPKKPILDPSPITVPIFDPVLDFIRNFIPEDIFVPGDVTVPGTVPGGLPGDITDVIPDVTGGIKDPLGGLIGDVTDVIGDPGPLPPVVVGKDVEIPDGPKDVINPGELQPQPTYGMAWLKSLSPEELWQLVKANVFEDKLLMASIVLGVGISFLDGPVPIGDAAGLAMVLSRLSMLLKLKKLKIPAALLLAGVTSTVPSLANASETNNKIESNSSSSDIASLQLNTRKTDTIVIITDSGDLSD